MRETKTGFGAKQQYQQHAEGGLEPDEQDSDEDDVEDEDGEDVDVDDGEEDDDQSDHNF